MNGDKLFEVFTLHGVALKADLAQRNKSGVKSCEGCYFYEGRTCTAIKLRIIAAGNLACCSGRVRADRTDVIYKYVQDIK